MRTRTVAALALCAATCWLACGGDDAADSDALPPYGDFDAAYDGWPDGDVLPVTVAPPCADKRIRIVYSAPESLPLGQLTRIEAQLIDRGGDPSDAGAHELTWFVENDDFHTARGRVFEMADCAPGSAGCVQFACTDPGDKELDDDGPRAGGLFVVVRYRDELCFDTARILLRCLLPLL